VKETYVYFTSTYCIVCTSSENAGIKNKPHIGRFLLIVKRCVQV